MPNRNVLIVASIKKYEHKLAKTGNDVIIHLVCIGGTTVAIFMLCVLFMSRCVYVF